MRRTKRNSLITKDYKAFLQPSSKQINAGISAPNASLQIASCASSRNSGIHQIKINFQLRRGSFFPTEFKELQDLLFGVTQISSHNSYIYFDDKGSAGLMYVNPVINPDLTRTLSLDPLEPNHKRILDSHLVKLLKSIDQKLKKIDYPETIKIYFWQNNTRVSAFVAGRETRSQQEFLALSEEIRKVELVETKYQIAMLLQIVLKEQFGNSVGNIENIRDSGDLTIPLPLLPHEEDQPPFVQIRSDANSYRGGCSFPFIN